MGGSPSRVAMSGFDSACNGPLMPCERNGSEHAKSFPSRTSERLFARRARDALSGSRSRFEGVINCSAAAGFQT